jgi:hypothetical protein
MISSLGYDFYRKPGGGWIGEFGGQYGGLSARGGAGTGVDGVGVVGGIGVGGVGLGEVGPAGFASIDHAETVKTAAQTKSAMPLTHAVTTEVLVIHIAAYSAPEHTGRTRLTALAWRPDSSHDIARKPPRPIHRRVSSTSDN